MICLSRIIKTTPTDALTIKNRIKAPAVKKNLVWFFWNVVPWEPEKFTNHMVLETYRQVSNIRRTKSQHLKDYRTLLRMSLPNPLKSDVKSRMKM